MSIPYRKILVPLDGSEFALQALPHAEAIARGLGAQLIVFEVVQDPTLLLGIASGVGMTGSGGGVGGGAIGVAPFPADAETHTKAMDEAKEALDELVTSLRHRKINAVADIDAGNPAAKIIDYATEHEIDLIVMSSHGRTGVQRWTYGSVANKVLHAAPCALLVVRPTLH
ncbi:MAG: universal stress protein [Caldilineaceae bacterium]